MLIWNKCKFTAATTSHHIPDAVEPGVQNPHVKAVKLHMVKV